MSGGRDLTQAEKEAAEWVVLLDAPNVPLTEISRFQAWLGVSDENKRAWESLSKTWDLIGSALAAMPQEELRRGLPTRAEARRRRLARGGLAALGAAALAAAALLAVLTPLPVAQSPSPAGAHTVSTPVREGRTLTLADGTTVELSPLARLNIAYSERERRVEVLEGVALFHVHTDTARPFVASTRYGEVHTDAAAFSLRVSSSGAQAAILTGVVAAHPQAPASLWDRLQNQSAPLSAAANDAITFKPHALSAEHLTPEVMRARLAWREGFISLDGQTLRDAATEVTRFSGVVFSFADRATAELPVAGYLNAADADAFLRLLANNFAISSVKRRDGSIVLRANR